MKKLLQNKTFLAWFSGFLLITIFLFITVFQYPGYIYYWDLSGAFSLREPFEQYFSTYTLHDGTEVGLKNRIPIVSFIWLVTKFFTIFGFSEGEIAVKVAVWFMFIGAYSAMFFVVGKFDEIFSRKFAVLDRTAKMNLVFRTIAALLYLAIPFYVYRISQLHLFFFTTFYPLLIYLYLRFLTSERRDWLKWAGALIIGLFFGITSPHSILYYALTFIVLTLGTWAKVGYSLKAGVAYFVRLLLVGLSTAVVSLYWLVPYIIEGSPAPGYMINIDTISFLAQNSTFIKFIMDVSEWYMGQNPSLGALLSGSPLITLQYVGIASLYGFATYYVWNRFKSSPHVRWVLLILVLSLVFGVREIPGFSAMYEWLSFSSFGWIIREPNRIRFLWSFWVYLFAVLGFYRYILLTKRENHGRFLSISTYLTLLVTVVSYLFYVLPGFFQHVNYLKPTIVSPAFSVVQEKLAAQKNTWGGVHVYPRIGGYGISWKEPHFPIADETEYLFLPYNLPVAPVQRASVLASPQSDADAMGTAFLERQIDLSPSQLRQLGIEYFLIIKEPRPLYPEFPSLQTDINQVLAFLAMQKNLEKLVDNSQYALYKLQLETEPILAEKPVQSPAGQEIFSKAELINGLLVRSNNFSQLAKTLKPDDVVVVYKDSDLAYLDYLSAETYQKYEIDIFSKVKRFSPNVSWGRMSLSNKVNGEARNILRNAGIYTYDTDRLDQVIYSDKALYKEKVDKLVIPYSTSCESVCELYVKLLLSKKGGAISFAVDDKTPVVVKTNNERETYQWVKVGALSDTNRGNITINVENGFQSIARMVLLPKAVVSSAEAAWKLADIRILDPKGSWTVTTLPACRINESIQRGEIVWDVRISCPDTAVLSLPHGWKGSTYLYADVNGGVKIEKNGEEAAYEYNGKIYFITLSTIFLWVLVIINYSQVAVILALLARSKKA